MLKRVFDLVVATLALAVLLLPFGILWFLVRWKLGSPVLFSQERPGLHGKVFRIYKFRTMTEVKDAKGLLLPDEQRLVGLGRFLRSTSLDELPGLFNVLKGQMSLVGPRPLLVDYLDRYTTEQARRHDVRPGITGWTQVNGRNALSWEEKFKLDIWYVDNRSFWLDMKILCLTAGKIFSQDGISAEGSATMPRFTGSPRGGSA